MKLLRYVFLWIFSIFLISTFSKSANNSHVYKIPKVEGIAVDGLKESWGIRAFRVYPVRG